MISETPTDLKDPLCWLVNRQGHMLKVHPNEVETPRAFKAGFAITKLVLTQEINIIIKLSTVQTIGKGQHWHFLNTLRQASSTRVHWKELQVASYTQSCEGGYGAKQEGSTFFVR